RTPWAPISENGLKTSAAYSREAEQASVIAMWREILDMTVGAESELTATPAAAARAQTPYEVQAEPASVTTFDESKVDITEHQLPKPFGTLCSLDQDNLLRYALARSYCRGKTVLDAAMGCGY